MDGINPGAWWNEKRSGVLADLDLSQRTFHQSHEVVGGKIKAEDPFPVMRPEAQVQPGVLDHGIGQCGFESRRNLIGIEQ